MIPPHDVLTPPPHRARCSDLSRLNSVLFAVQQLSIRDLILVVILPAIDASGGICSTATNASFAMPKSLAHMWTVEIREIRYSALMQ